MVLWRKVGDPFPSAKKRANGCKAGQKAAKSKAYPLLGAAEAERGR
jgi:hypothetical protein